MRVVTGEADRSGADLECYQAPDIFGVCFLGLGVPENNTSLRPVRPSEGVHHSPRKIAPQVVGLNTGKINR